LIRWRPVRPTRLEQKGIAVVEALGLFHEPSSRFVELHGVGQQVYEGAKIPEVLGQVHLSDQMPSYVQRHIVELHHLQRLLSSPILLRIGHTVQKPPGASDHVKTR
jgi:hypothetical protein